MAKEKRFTFIQKKNAPETKLSVVLATISLVAMGVLFLVSLGFQGKGGLAVGAAGLASMLIAFYAFFLGMKVLSRRDPEYRLPTFSALYAGSVAIVWVGLFIWGVR